MSTQQRLLAALRDAFPGESDAAIARRAGLSQQRFSNYAHALRAMDDDAVIGCAKALGLDPRVLVAKHRQEVAKTDRERNFWRRFGTAASVALAVALPWNPATASDQATSAHPMHYAKSRRFAWQRILAALARTVRRSLELERHSHGPSPLLA